MIKINFLNLKKSIGWTSKILVSDIFTVNSSKTQNLGVKKSNYKYIYDNFIFELAIHDKVLQKHDNTSF